MTKENGRTIRIRRYQSVTDRVSRRIYKLDRWRIPWATGLPVIALVYFATSLGVVAIASRLPIVGYLLGLLPFSLVWIGIPAVSAWALATFTVDGRPPHRVALALLRWRSRPRVLAGLRGAPAVGSSLVPVAEVTVAPSGDEASYPGGRVKGPALVTFRYPARLHPEGVPRRLRGRPFGVRARAARRLRLEQPADRGRPLRDGVALRIRGDQVVVFE